MPLNRRNLMKYSGASVAAMLFGLPTIEAVATETPTSAWDLAGDHLQEIASHPDLHRWRRGEIQGFAADIGSTHIVAETKELAHMRDGDDYFHKMYLMRLNEEGNPTATDALSIYVRDEMSHTELIHLGVDSYLNTPRDLASRQMLSDEFLTSIRVRAWLRNGFHGEGVPIKYKDIGISPLPTEVQVPTFGN